MKNETRFAFLRITFGCIWIIDAWFKWQPAFLNGLVDMLNSMLPGQPSWVQSWIHIWINIISVHPHLFAVLIALIETAIAFGLIFGLMTRITLIVSIIFAFLLWSIGEAFGGPYVAGSTDIGCAIIYIFVLLALYFGNSWRVYSLDSILVKKYPKFLLWKDVDHESSNRDNKDRIISVLVLGIVVLGSILLARYIPTQANAPISSSQNMQMGPGAMAPQGMVLKTFNLQPTDPVPTVSFDITRDPVSMGGWDVHIKTTNFQFTPQNVNQAPVADQGHVHLYVDNTMYVVYGNWYHLDDVPPGQHLITVSLMANDHSIFSKNGQYIEATKTIEQ